MFWTVALLKFQPRLLIQYLSRGIQFSRASLNEALTKHKNKDIKTLKLDNLYYYMRNFCNLIGLEQWYFSLI